jgi:hypothetical protein
VTWGDEGSLSDPENDAYIAQQLANHFNVEHFYCTTDITSDVELETLLNRYLVAGEGRIDHINAYLDGFRMWKMFFEAGVSGIIRGDEGFGHSDPTSSISRILYKDGLLRFSDFANLPEGLYLDFPLQTLPDYLHKGNQESIAAWRIRLYHEFRLPIILAALSDLKLSYLEVANPLLSRKIIAFVRQLPDELRKGKFLFKRIVQQKSPDIPFASRRAIPSSEKILATSHFQSLFVEELCSWETKSLFPEEMVRFIIDFLQTPKTSPNMLGKSWRRIYDRIALSNRTSQKFDMDLDKLALRIYLICKMKRILHEDTKLVRER